MRICQINPGILPIPRTTYGAIESIIWEYTKYLKCDIKYPNEIKRGDYDIVHVHVANQALMLAEKGIPYVFHMHDHHTVRFGKNSQCFKENRKAIEQSLIALVPAEYLVHYFDHPYKTFYFAHGVNTDFWKPASTYGSFGELLCIANNGYADDVLADRKGFIPAIQTAQALDMGITIVGPSKNNKVFFEKLSPTYSKLKIIYDVSDTEIRNMYQNHSIFLHLSELEAGQPNLTLLEAMACGLPVIGTYSGRHTLTGVKKVNRTLKEVIEAVLEVKNNWGLYHQKSLDTAVSHNYTLKTKQLFKIYESILSVTKEFDSDKFKKDLIENYSSGVFSKVAPKEVQDVFAVHFIDGAFIETKGYTNNAYEVEFYDDHQNTLLYKSTIKTNCWVKTNAKYYINYNIKIFDQQHKLIFTHKFDAKNKRVYIGLDSKSLGDTLAWFPYVEEFRKKHDCEMICSTFWNDLFIEKYPQIQFVAPGTTIDNVYALYNIGLYEPTDRMKHRSDPRLGSLQKIASDTLGLSTAEIKPLIVSSGKPRPLKEKYIAIGTTSTAQAKFWNNERGWQTLINYLNDYGFKVVILQKEDTNLQNVIVPKSKEILDTINWLEYAEFFIGLSSGVSWLAWALNKQVVMISGFTAPFNEFQCIRLHNSFVCNSCWNDQNHKFDKGDWNWCPRNQNFICSKIITPENVIKSLKTNNLV